MSETKDNEVSNLPQENGLLLSSKKKIKDWNSELEDNAFLFDDLEESSVVDERWRVCFNWYVRNSRFYKYLFYTLMIASSICPMVAAAINTSCSDGQRWWISIFSLIASASTALLSIFRAQEKWTEYRSAAEFLKRSRVKYMLDVKINGKTPEKEMEFLTLMENYMEGENSRWCRSNRDEEKGKLDADVKTLSDSYRQDDKMAGKQKDGGDIDVESKH